MFADNLTHENYSEHSQALALLARVRDGEQREQIAHGLLNERDLARTTIYFSHYLFEAYRKIDRTDKIFERLGLWFDLKASGLRTTIEHPEPTRSDCHAWGAHPLFHYYTTFLGIHPKLPACSELLIHPQPGPLKQLCGTLPTPQGEVEVNLKRDGERWQGYVNVPEGVDEVDFRLNGNRQFLGAGRQEIEL